MAALQDNTNRGLTRALTHECPHVQLCISSTCFSNECFPGGYTRSPSKAPTSSKMHEEAPPQPSGPLLVSASLNVSSAGSPGANGSVPTTGGNLSPGQLFGFAETQSSIVWPAENSARVKFWIWSASDRKNALCT